MASNRPRRKAIPFRVKLVSTLIATGMRPGVAEAVIRHKGVDSADRERLLEWALGALGLPDDVEFDHDPPLGLRRVNAASDDYDPPQLDPRHIVPRGYVEHRTKTSGTPPGQKVVHVADGDQHKIAKAKRLAEARLADLARGRFGFTEVRMEPGVGIVSEYQPIEGYKPDDPLPPEVLSVFDVAERATRGAFKRGRKMQSRPFPKKRKPADG